MINEKKLKELQLLDELFLTTENSKYLDMRDREIEKIISNENFENHLGKVCLNLVEYNDLEQYEKDVIDEEIEMVLFSRIEELVENR